jgi:hypothetical protein
MYSRFVGQPDGPTQATHFMLGPVGYSPTTVTGEHQPVVLGADSEIRLYVYEHAHVVSEMLKVAVRDVAIDMYDDALERLTPAKL